MKTFVFITFLFVISCIFWAAEVSTDLLEQQCHLEQSVTERVISTVKEVLGVASPDTKWWQPLCNLTGPKVRGIVTIVCNVVITGACVIYFQKRHAKKKDKTKIQRKVATTPGKYDKRCSKFQSRRIFRNTLRIKGRDYYEKPREQPLEYPRQASKRSYNEEAHTVIKKARPSDKPFKPREKSHLNRRRSQRKPWFDGYLFIPHVPTTEERVYRAILLGPVNTCMEYLMSLLTSTCVRCGVASDTIKWARHTDPMGTIIHLSGESDRMKVEVGLVPYDGINIRIHRVVKAEGLVRLVVSTSYQLTYRGLICVDQSSTTLYGAGWNL